jgi:hypothetical protein
MSKIKLFLLLMILGYGGYFAWKYFAERGGLTPRLQRGGRESSITVASPSNAEDATPRPKLPPLAQHHQDLQTVSGLIFAPLKSGSVSQVSNLKRIWDLSRSDYNQGLVSEADARVLADLIRQLNLMEKDRELYLSRFRELATMQASAFIEGMSVEQKRGFAEKELNRQWQDLVKVNKDKLQPLFDALSE